MASTASVSVSVEKLFSQLVGELADKFYRVHGLRAYDVCLGWDSAPQRIGDPKSWDLVSVKIDIATDIVPGKTGEEL